MRIILIILAVLVLSPSTLAQSATEIHGRVTDQRKASVAGAEVSLRSRSGAEFVALTDDNGEYKFKGLAASEYVIEVKAKGFAIFTSKALHLERGQSMSNDIELLVEAVNGTVVITANGTAQSTDEISKAISVLSDQTIEAKHE